jgi:hypothetical protein
MKLLNKLFIILLPSALLAMEDQPKTEEEKKVYQPTLLFEQNLKVVANQLLNLIKQQQIDTAVAQLMRLPEELRISVLEAILQQLPGEQITGGVTYAPPMFKELNLPFTELALPPLRKVAAEGRTIETLLDELYTQSATEAKNDLLNLMLKKQYVFSNQPLLKEFAVRNAEAKQTDPAMAQNLLEKLHLLTQITTDQEKFDALHFLAFELISTPENEKNKSSQGLAAFELLSNLISQANAFNVVSNINKVLIAIKNSQLGQMLRIYNKNNVDKMLEIILKIQKQQMEQL